jgi:hypothetical protein
MPNHLQRVSGSAYPDIVMLRHCDVASSADGGWSGVLTPALTGEPVLLTMEESGLLGTLNTLAGIAGGILTAVSLSICALAVVATLLGTELTCAVCCAVDADDLRHATV